MALIQTLRGKRICVTGKFLQGLGTREEVKQCIREHGGIVQQTVNSRTDYLVIGDGHAGSTAKSTAAHGHCTKLLSERDFMAMVSHGTDRHRELLRDEADALEPDKRRVIKGVPIDRAATRKVIAQADEDWEDINI